METSSILQLDLRQFNFTSYLNSAREGFVGRKWLFDRIENILDNRTKDLSAIIVVGEPGSGKSAISAQLICSRLSSSFIHHNILGYHLCKHLDKITMDGGKFVKNLVDMIASQIPKFIEIISGSSVIQRVLREDCSRDPHGCFEQAIIAPLRQLKVQDLERKLYFIVIDAIDECAPSGGGSMDIASSIVELIKHKMLRLPSWLKLIITSRNDSKILKHFLKSVTVDLIPAHSDNMGDIKLFITTTLYEHFSLFQTFKNFFKFEEDEISSLTSSLLRQSQGNFLFVKELIHFWLAESFASSLKSIPPTIGGIYFNYFERAYGSKENFRIARKTSEVLVASFVPLSEEEIFKVLYLEDPQLDYTYSEFINNLNGLSHFLRYGEGNTVSLFHLSLLEWLIDENNIASPYFVDKKKGHLTLATYLLKNANNSSNLNHKQTPVLHLAQHIAFSGHLSFFYDEFQKLPTTLITTPIDDSQRTLLHLGAAVKNVDVIRLLLPFFWKPADLKDDYGVTPSFVAAAHGGLENLKFLLGNGANISHRTNPPPKPPYEFHQDPIIASKTAFWSSTLLHAASQNGHLDVVKFLLQQNVSLTERNGVNLSALQLAAQNGHLEVVTLLHKNGAQADQGALYHAAANGHDDVVKFLLQNAGVKDDCMRCDGSFYWLGGKMRYQAALIEPEFKSSGEFKKYKSALWHLAQPEYLKLKISDFRFVNDKHLILCQTALHMSVLKSHLEVVQTLLSQSDNALQCTDFTGRTPLHDAVRSNNKAIAEVLLRAGANVIKRCRFHQNLTLASSSSYRKYNHLNVMEEYQYDSEICPQGSTPMHLAAIHGHTHMAAVLKNYRASFYITDFQGATSLHIAACHGETEFIQWPISSSPEMHINTASENGSTPLHSAAICGRFAEIPILIELGADTKSQDKKGMTALHYTTRKTTMLPDIRNRTDEFQMQPVLSFGWLRMWISNDEDHIRYQYIFTNKYPDSETHVLHLDRHCKTALRLIENMDVTTINQEDNLGRTTLHLAAEKGLECIVGLLLANNALPQKENNAGLTPLEVAIKSFDPTISFDIFTCKCDLSKAMYDTLITQTECEVPVFNSSLHDLIDHLLTNLGKQAAVVHILFSWELENGQKCMLCRAVEEQQPHLVLLMLLMGADVNQEDSLGSTPLLAYLHNGGDFTGFILKNFNVHVPVACGKPFRSSPFHLLSYWAPTLQSDNFFEANGNLRWIRQLYRWEQFGYEMVSKCQDAEGYTPLHRAAQGGNIQAIERFLSWGVDIEMLSRDGHTPLSLAIKYAGLKPDVSKIIVNTTKASKVAILILREIFKKTNFKIKCDGTSTELTIYHLAAYRGLHEFLQHLLDDLKPRGLDIDCPDKFGVTPLYLAKLFIGDGTDNKLHPWKKIVRLIESYGGTLRYPHKEAELRLLYIHLYDTTKQSTHINTSLAEKLLQLLERTDNLDHCFELFHALVQTNKGNNFLFYSVREPFFHHKDSFQDELLASLSMSDSKIMLKIFFDYYTLMEGMERMFKKIIHEMETKQERQPFTSNEQLDYLVSINATLTEWWRKSKQLKETYLSNNITFYEYMRLFLSKLNDFLSREEKWLSRFSSFKAMKTSFPVLHQKLRCEKMATYKDAFFDNLKLHLAFPHEIGWTWKRKHCFRDAPLKFMRSRLSLILKDITDYRGRYGPFEVHDLVQLIKIVLCKRSRFDYLDLLAFGGDHSLWHSVQIYHFHWSVRKAGRREKISAVGKDQVKTLVDEMKEGVIAEWKRNKAKKRKQKHPSDVLGNKITSPR